jgi:hypothetical protein
VGGVGEGEEGARWLACSVTGQVHLFFAHALNMCEYFARKGGADFMFSSRTRCWSLQGGFWGICLRQILVGSVHTLTHLLVGW